MSQEPYARLVVSLPWHDKLCDIEDDADRISAFGLYAAAVCYCQANLTDGRIRRIDLSRVFPLNVAVPQDDIEEERRQVDLAHIADVLVSAGLFEADSKAFYVHDYLDFNRSREQIEGISNARKLAGSAGGVAKAVANAKQTPSKPVANAKQTPTQRTTTKTETTTAAKTLCAPKCFTPSDHEIVAAKIATRFPSSTSEDVDAAVASLLAGCDKRCSGLHSCWRDYFEAKLKKAKSVQGLIRFLSEDGRAA